MIPYVLFYVLAAIVFLIVSFLFILVISIIITRNLK